MPRTVYHPDSGAFEVFATEDEKRMDALKRENAELKTLLDRATFALSRIENTIRENGMDVDENAVDLGSLGKAEVNAIAQRLGVAVRPNKSDTIREIQRSATPYQIWKAHDNGQ